MATAEIELYLVPEYQAWSRTGTLWIACSDGGAVAFEAADERTVGVNLAGCEFTDGLPISGSGEIRGAGDEFELRATYPGATVEYRRVADARRVDGTVDGTPGSIEE